MVRENKKTKNKKQKTKNKKQNNKKQKTKKYLQLASIEHSNPVESGVTF